MLLETGASALRPQRPAPRLATLDGYIGNLGGSAADGANATVLCRLRPWVSDRVSLAAMRDRIGGSVKGGLEPVAILVVTAAREAPLIDETQALASPARSERSA
jgi:hypothetical protein